MEHTKHVLTMQRQRPHIHENQRKDVGGSDHPVDVRAFRQQQNSDTRKQR